MESASPSSSPCSIVPVVYTGGASAFEHQRVELSKRELIQLKWDANYWQAQHRGALARIAQLEKEIEHLEAKNRDLQQRLFGRRSEKGGGKSEAAPNSPD